MGDKQHSLTFDNSQNTETSSDMMCDKPPLIASDNTGKPEPSPDTSYDRANIFAADSSKKPEASPDTVYDKPYLFASDISKKSEAPSDTMYDKPHLFASDHSRKSDTSPDMIMPENIRKRRSITVKEKLDILDMVDSGLKLSHVARKFGISSSTASTIVKERDKIKMLSDHYNIDPERKRMRLGIYRDVDEAVHLWFRQMRMKNIPINGPMLQQKAREFAIQLGHQNFEGSSGWLFRFRERHGLSVKTMRDNDDNNAFNCSGVGMTDDEIVTSVCQNTANSLKFFLSICDNKDNTKEKTKNNYKNNKVSNNNTDIRQEVPENYLVPEIELTDYEPTVSLPEAISLAEKLTSFLKDHDVPPDILKSMNTVTNFIEYDIKNQMKQRKITDFFKASKP